jgi:hypothetical protein
LGFPTDVCIHAITTPPAEAAAASQTSDTQEHVRNGQEQGPASVQSVQNSLHRIEPAL